MSLINQVLRDLDARHAARENRALPSEVRPLPPAGADRRGVVTLSAIASLALMGAVWWAARDNVASPVSAAPAPVASTPVVETPAPPVLVIAPPPALSTEETPAPPAAGARPPADAPPASLQMAGSLKTAVPVAPPVAPPRIEKQSRDDGRGLADAAWRRAAGELREGRTEEATASLREALRAEPGHTDARQLLLSILVERRQWPEAEALLRAGLESVPGHGPWAMALARIQVERGQTELAWQTLDKYLPAGQNDADYQGFAGVLLQRLQRPAEAIRHYEAALSLKPEARWWAGLGLALEAAGRTDEAREALHRAQAAGGLTPDMAAVVERHLK